MGERKYTSFALFLLVKVLIFIERWSVVMKRRLLASGLLIVLLAVMAYGSIAYLTSEGHASNIITTGTIKLNIHEMQIASEGELVDYPADGLITGVLPGQAVSKIPYVENVGNQDFYTRVKIKIEVTAADGSTILDNAVIQPDIDTKNWTLKDGWYYYTGKVSAGKRVAPFESVKFSEDMANEYQGCKVKLDIDAQAVQVKNNPIPDNGSILDIVGWPEIELQD